jgi:hypothetical protein
MLSGNTANGGLGNAVPGGAGDGGGIFNSGTLTVSQSMLSSNTPNGGAGAPGGAAHGSGIFNESVWFRGAAIIR